MSEDSAQPASKIELACLAPDAGRAAIEKLCARAKAEQFSAVCVNLTHIELAVTLLEDTEIKVVSFAGFPLGASDADSKFYETEAAIDLGAQEIEYVINLGRLKDGDRRYVLREMHDIFEASDEIPVKAIIEAHLLTRDEKLALCDMAQESGMKFLSLATDYHSPEPSLDDLRLLRDNLSENIGIKVCGGIHDASLAAEWINAGAARVGLVA